MNTIEADFEGCYMPQDPRWIGYEEMDKMMNGYRIWAYIFDECGGGARRRLRINVQHRLLLRRSEKASPRVDLGVSHFVGPFTPPLLLMYRCPLLFFLVFLLLLSLTLRDRTHFGRFLINYLYVISNI